MKVAFLDRDGVINNEVNYLHKIEDFEYTYRCVDALKKIQSLGYKIIVVTNQAGIAKGYYSEQDYQKLTSWYVKDLAKKGVEILDVIHCPHHPEGIVDGLGISCICRKPEPGMILSMVDKYNVNLSASVMIGDKVSDIEAADTAGIPVRILVKSGHSMPPRLQSGQVVLENLYEVSIYLS